MKDFGLENNFDWVPIEARVSKTKIQCGIWEFKARKKGVFYLSSISRTGLNKLLYDAGFRKLQETPEVIVQVIGSQILLRSIADLKDFLNEYLRRLPDEGISLVMEDCQASKLDLEETYFRQFHSVINASYLEHLYPLDKPILQDDKLRSYIPYQNVIVRVDMNGVSLLNYQDLSDCLVWRDQIIPRNFTLEKIGAVGHFKAFISNISNGDEKRIAAITSAIGYLLHNYSNPTMGQAVILTDEKITDPNSPQGGTGKGIITKALGMLRQIVKIDGKQMKPGDRFSFQSVIQTTQVICIDDITPQFDFMALFSNLTDGLTVEKKRQSSFVIPAQRSPKILINSNTILEFSGTSNKRRQFIFELSDHYSSRIRTGSETPIKDEHGCIFFDDDFWDKAEWNAFDSFMIECLELYMRKGLVQSAPINLGINRLIQQTSEDFVEWVKEKNFQTDIEYNTREHFEEFKAKYYGEQDKLSQRRFSFMLKHFAATSGYIHKAISSGGIQKFEFTVVK